MSGWAGVKEVAVCGLLVLLAFLFLPVALALLATILCIVGLLLFDARKNKMLLIMALRNISRKRSTTALAVGGLMIGTAIISAAFAVSDTMNNMTYKEYANDFGEVDYTIQSPGQGSLNNFNATALGPIVAQMKEVPHVETVETVVELNPGAMDNGTGLFSTSFLVVGMSSQNLSDLGGVYDTGGHRITQAPAGGTVYLNQKAVGDLDAHAGDTIILVQGHDRVPFTLTKVLKDQGLGCLGLQEIALIDLGTAQAMSGGPGTTNTILVSIEGKELSGLGHAGSVHDGINGVLKASAAMGLVIQGDRAQMIKNTQTSVKSLSDMFFIFGTFSIISGVVLIINIFTMLGEERKSEFGTLRAMGIVRAELQRAFLYEGLIYASVASGIGALLGIGLAYAMIVFLGTTGMFGTAQSVVTYFTFTQTSLMLSYMFGFLLTLLTVFFATRRITHLNIVRAIRNIPEPVIDQKDRRMLAYGALCLGGGGLLLMLGVLGSIESFAMAGLSLVTLSLGLLLRSRLGDRAAWSIASVLTLIPWLPGVRIFAYPSGLEMFVLSGLFQVTAMLLLVVFNLESIVGFFTWALRLKGPSRAVLVTSMSYPTKSKFRSAMSIFIFGLVMFTITSLSIIGGATDLTVAKEVGRGSGGYDLFAFGNPGIPVDDMWGEINTSTHYMHKGNVTDLVAINRGVGTLVHIDTSGDFNQPCPLYGVDGGFYGHGKFPLNKWNRTQYPTEQDVWNAVMANSSLVITDGASRLQGVSSSFMGIHGPAVNIGDTITVKAYNGTTVNMTLVGIMDQYLMQGLFMSKGTLGKDFGVRGASFFLIQLKGGLDTNKQSIMLRKDFLGHGLQTIAIKLQIKAWTGQIEALFGLLNAFLAIGLIIGLAGLGIMTIRSIQERRLEIGVMRAIGYPKRMIVANFALESILISVLGLLLGIGMGILCGFKVWTITMNLPGTEFLVPWLTIVTVSVASIVITLLSIFPAARGASKVSPAEVLKYE